MIEITGKYNSAKVFTDVVDSASTAQVLELCNQEFTAGSRIRMMPDIHAGAGCTIGTTMTVTDKIVPNLVGVDIGCGMETLRLAETHIELQKLDKLIYEKIPSGFDIRKKPHRYADNIDLSRLHCADHVDLTARITVSARSAAAITSSSATATTTAISTSSFTRAAATSESRSRAIIRKPATTR